MAQSKARVCLFTFFLMPLIVSLSASQPAAAVMAEADVQRDLEEIELLHETERRFTSRLSIEPLCHIECDFFDRAELLERRRDFKNAKNALAKELDKKELNRATVDLTAVDLTENADLAIDQFDVPPGPRNLRTEGALELATDFVGPVLLKSEEAPESEGTLTIELMPESRLCETELGQCDVSTYHLAAINRRRAWNAASDFIAARRANLVDSIQFTTGNVKSLCFWAEEQLQAAQIQIASDGSKKRNHENSSSASDVDVDESLQPVAEKDSEVVESIVEPEISLEPISTRKIPMFQVAIVDVVEADEPASQSVKQEQVSLEPISGLPIAMFLVADVETSESKIESEKADEADANEAEVSGEVESADSVLPEDLFIDQTESSISIELEQSDRDPYWQYYDDCDRWGVNFAKLVHEAQLYRATGVEPTANKPVLTTVANRLRPKKR